MDKTGGNSIGSVHPIHTANMFPVKQKIGNNAIVNEPKSTNINQTVTNTNYVNNNVNNTVINSDSINTPQSNNIVHKKAFVKYHLSDVHIERHISEEPLEVRDEEEEATAVCLLHFDKFDLILRSDDARVPRIDSTAEVEVCKKLIMGGTKTLHFLKLLFPKSGRRLAAQILPPWRSMAGVKMARMGGAAVLTNCPKDIFRRTARRTVTRGRNNRR